MLFIACRSVLKLVPNKAGSYTAELGSRVFVFSFIKGSLLQSRFIINIPSPQSERARWVPGPRCVDKTARTIWAPLSRCSVGRVGLSKDCDFVVFGSV